jgi:hypothetical protein
MTDHGKMTLGFRDAVHVPYVIVSCNSELQPGEKVSLRHDNRCVRWDDFPEIEWHGVVDPFRTTTVPAGAAFPVYIRKECFSGLRHDFTIEVHDRGGTDTCHAVCDIF